MAEIVLELTIEATPEHVFHALTTPDGIAGWWSNLVTDEPKVGALTEVHFESGVMQMEMTDLEVGKKVQWRVRRSPHDWEGSPITWNLTPISKGTRLLFGQHDLFVGATGYSIEQTRAGLNPPAASSGQACRFRPTGWGRKCPVRHHTQRRHRQPEV